MSSLCRQSIKLSLNRPCHASLLTKHELILKHRSFRELKYPRNATRKIVDYSKLYIVKNFLKINSPPPPVKRKSSRAIIVLNRSGICYTSLRHTCQSQTVLFQLLDEIKRFIRMCNLVGILFTLSKFNSLALICESDVFPQFRLLSNLRPTTLLRFLVIV